MSRICVIKNPRRVNLYLPADLIDAAKGAAVAEHKSISALMAEALHAYLPKKTLAAFRATAKPTAKRKKV